MRHSVRRTRQRHILWTGAAGALLGIPFTLSAAGTLPAGDPSAGSAPSIQPAAASSPQAPANSQFQAERYEAEVQRQLRLLYQQQPQAGSPAPGPSVGGRPVGPPKPRRMKLKDYFNPSAWKRQHRRRQRYNDYQRRLREQQADSVMPETDLGAPHDMTLGRQAPIAPAVPIPATNGQLDSASPSGSAAPRAPLPAPAAAVAPSPAFAASAQTPAVVPQRPQLERVSPELFGLPASDDASLAAEEGPAFELLLPDAPTVADQPGLMPSSDSAELTPIESPENQTPTLILVPNPQAPALLGDATLPQAPAAEIAEVESDAGRSQSGGFFNQSDEPFAFPVTETADELNAANDFLPPATMERNEVSPAGQDAGPFTGLELEDNPFVDPPAANVNPPGVDDSPASVPSPVAESPLPIAEAEPKVEDETSPTLVAPAPTTEVATPLVESPAPAETKTASTAPPRTAPTSAPATLTSPSAARQLPEEPAPTKRAVRPDIQKKLDRIAERQGLTGFKGFCPVMLTDYRELVDAKLEHTTEHEGRQYWFSSSDARERFMLDPTAYVPARGGIDVVIFDQTGESREGSLDHAVWFRGKLYLFDSADSRAAFAAAPQEHLVAK